MRQALWPHVEAALERLSQALRPAGVRPDPRRAHLHPGHGRRDRDRADAAPSSTRRWPRAGAGGRARPAAVFARPTGATRAGQRPTPPSASSRTWPQRWPPRARAGDDRPRSALHLRIRLRDAARAMRSRCGSALSLDDYCAARACAGELRRSAARLRRRGAGARRPRAPGDADRGQPASRPRRGWCTSPTCWRCCRSASFPRRPRPRAGPWSARFPSSARCRRSKSACSGIVATSVTRRSAGCAGPSPRPRGRSRRLRARRRVGGHRARGHRAAHAAGNRAGRLTARAVAGAALEPGWLSCSLAAHVPAAAATPADTTNDFRRVLAGEGISNFGSMLTWLALPWLATLALAATLPADGAAPRRRCRRRALLAPCCSGRWSTGCPKRTVMIATDLARAALLGGLAALAWAHLLSAWLPAAAAALSGALGVAFELARSAWVAQSAPAEQLPGAQCPAVGRGQHLGDAGVRPRRLALPNCSARCSRSRPIPSAILSPTLCLVGVRSGRDAAASNDVPQHARASASSTRP